MEWEEQSANGKSVQERSENAHPKPEAAEAEVWGEAPVVAFANPTVVAGVGPAAAAENTTTTAYRTVLSQDGSG